MKILAVLVLLLPATLYGQTVRSGDYEPAPSQTGRLWSNVIDPATGEPVAGAPCQTKWYRTQDGQMIETPIQEVGYWSAKGYLFSVFICPEAKPVADGTASCPVTTMDVWAYAEAFVAGARAVLDALRHVVR